MISFELSRNADLCRYVLTTRIKDHVIPIPTSLTYLPAFLKPYHSAFSAEPVVPIPRTTVINRTIGISIPDKLIADLHTQGMSSKIACPELMNV
jgi:hypothetical protein